MIQITDLELDQLTSDDIVTVLNNMIYDTYYEAKKSEDIPLKSMYKDQHAILEEFAHKLIARNEQKEGMYSP